MVAFAFGTMAGVLYKKHEKDIMNYMMKVTNKF